MLNVTNKADACDATIDGVNYCTRGFKIRMVCSPAVEYLPLENSIEEDAGCSYTVRVNSKYACPAQCPWGCLLARPFWPGLFVFLPLRCCCASMESPYAISLNGIWAGHFWRF